MTTRYLLYQNLAAEAEVPPDGILSRTLYQDDHVKVVLFGFAAGQELSAHTAPFRAAIHVLEGTAQLTLGSDQVEAGPGTWAMMEPQLEHGILAKTPVKMLLTMLRQAK
jgi:quercetin dioxygenase-like cupin family protein